MDMEKRKNQRVPFDTEAILRKNDKEAHGHVLNISMKGILLETDFDGDLDGLCTVTILLTGASTKLSLNVTGEVIRRSGNEIAVKFKEMDLDSFVHLKNLVSYNSSDADKIMDEYYRSITSE